jgi:hypothetical protein
LHGADEGALIGGMSVADTHRAIHAVWKIEAAAGVLVEVGDLKSSATGASLRLANGKITVIDGPFTEAKELIGGYAVYDTKTKEECIEWARRFLAIHKEHWPEFEGEVELREMMVFTPGR